MSADAPLKPLIMSKTSSTQVTKNRFVIAKNMVGKGLIVTFKNTKGDEVTYEHDKVFEMFKAKFEAMPCFNKYGNYTNSNNIPKFIREVLK